MMRWASDHADLANRTLYLQRDEQRQNGGYSLLVQTYPPHQPVQVQRGAKRSTIVLDHAQSDFLTLAGPSGRGADQLRVSTTVKTEGIGAEIYYTAWGTVKDRSARRTLLRYRDKLLEGRHWVAVPEKDGKGVVTWTIWSLEPSPANSGLLPGAIDVDVEVVPV